jgi:hypothetical protein
MVIKLSIGRLQVDLPELERQVPLQGFRWLPINNAHSLAAAALETDGVHPGSLRSPAGLPEPGRVREGHVIDGHLGAAGNGLVDAISETGFIVFAQHQTCQVKCFQRQAANPNHH